MNHELNERLRRMPLRQPPPSLDRWVSRHTRRRRALRLGTGLAAAAVLAALWFVARGVPHHRRAPDEALKPVRVERVWSRVADDGLVILDADTPYRTFRRWTVRYVWQRDLLTGAHFEMAVPAGEVVLVAQELY